MNELQYLTLLVSSEYKRNYPLMGIWYEAIIIPLPFSTNFYLSNNYSVQCYVGMKLKWNTNGIISRVLRIFGFADCSHFAHSTINVPIPRAAINKGHHITTLVMHNPRWFRQSSSCQNTFVKAVYHFKFCLSKNERICQFVAYTILIQYCKNLLG